VGERLLEVSTDMIIEIVKSLQSDTPRYFKVINDPLPANVKLRSINTSIYWPNTIEVHLESEDWSKEEPRTKVNPQLKLIEVGCDFSGDGA